LPRGKDATPPRPYIRDRARVIHSAAFRRLQAKTQVLGIGEGDFHRTRLTHSMEVAQIARGIVFTLKQGFEENNHPASKWLPGQNLIETISLSHDFGHPPFGHGGEVALNFTMRNHGGFEGNGQTLRLLSRLEAHTDDYGLDPTRRVLLGILKYPVNYSRIVRRTAPEAPRDLRWVKRDDWKPPKCYLATEDDVVTWIFEPFGSSDRDMIRQLKDEPCDDKHGKSKYHALDAGIMELADDIAYGIHDLEDAIVLRMISSHDWDAIFSKIDDTWAQEFKITRSTSENLFSGSGSARKRAIGLLVNALICSVEIRELSEFEHPLLKYQASLTESAEKFLRQAKSLVKNKVVNTPEVQTLEYRGQQLITSLFEAFASDPARLLKETFRQKHQDSKSLEEKNRVICDFIAGMTDEYATRMYERLFVPRRGQFSDRL
jgi:dGTPase